MANVARLDSRMRREFVTSYFKRHPRATLTDANDELKKKFRQGMGSKNLGIIKGHVLAEIADTKRGTRPLGQQHVPEHVQESQEEQAQLLAELKKTTEALAVVMTSPRCPVFQIILTKLPGGKVELTKKMHKLETITETDTY